MKYEFIHRDATGRLILIFAGWSADPSLYRHIHLEGWDLLVVYDYNDLVFPIQLLDDYHTISLFAWSLGVFVASRTIPFDRISIAVAVNGTENPVSDYEGIPEAIYEGTLSTLSERNLMKFRRRVYGDKYSELSPLFSIPEEGIDGLAAQLRLIRDVSGNIGCKNHQHSRWDRVYISLSDMIFPPDNQINSWNQNSSSPEIITLDAPHYIDFEKIIKGSLPSKSSVGKQFFKALTTYDDHAVAQKTIAARLLRLIERAVTENGRIIEIGPGTGIFTREYEPVLKPSEIDYIDLYPLTKFGAAPIERYHISDAEDWVANEAEKKPGSYDIIVSASTIQWIVNQDKFLGNLARLLRPGGILLCSTFLPGNLKEMRPCNPYGLVYRSAKEMKRILNRHFSDVITKEDTIVMNFDSPRDTLRHIHHTGVSGGISSDDSISALLRSTPTTLTYKPLYILAAR